jgi:hypothetical protein
LRSYLEETPTNTSPLHTSFLPSSNINFRKRDDFASVDNVLEHQIISDYLTTPHETSNNFSSSTGMIVSKLSCKALHRLLPLENDQAP